MRPAHCGITPEGWPCIGLTGLSALVFALLDWWFLALVLLALLALCIYPFIEARTLTVDEHTVQVANLPANLKNLKIVYATDIHQGRWFSQSRVNELVKTINGLSADLVILGGDYAEDSDGAIEFFENLPSISARIGVYAVLGNHDRTEPESNLSVLIGTIKGRGIIPLENHLLDGSLPTLVFTEVERPFPPAVEPVPLDFSTDTVPQMLDALYRRGIQSVLVEGGAEMLASFFRSGLWDRAYVFSAPQRFLGTGAPAPGLPDDACAESEETLGDDRLVIYRHLPRP